MLEAFDRIKERFQELSLKLSDPAVINNRSEYQRVSKEFFSVSRMHDKVAEIEKITGEIEDLKKELDSASSDEQFCQLAEEELDSLSEQLEKARDEFESLLLSESTDSSRSVIMEIRAGTGGLEAGLFAADLYRMYSKYSIKKNFKLEVLDSHQNENGGFKEIVLSLEGDGVFTCFQFESGGHRVQRVPQTESSGRIHTSACTVAVLPEPEDIDVHIDPKDLEIDVYRASGPGGQGVNTTDSAVRITHLPTGLVVTCQDERSQLKNKAKGMRILRARLYELKMNEQAQQLSDNRKKQVGSGDRSEKIRTYNFPERRITDHRINLTVYELDQVLEGEMDKIIQPLLKHDREVRLKEFKI